MPILDLTGHDISKPIPPMSLEKWESLQIKAETACLKHMETEEELRDEIKLLADAVFEMSAEIFRLRLTYGEDVWKAVYHSKQEDQIIRLAHEAEIGKYNKFSETTGG